MDKPNILFITIDSIRADHTGHHGYGRKTTPTIDSLANEGMVGERHMADGIPTYFAFKSLLSGVPPLSPDPNIGVSGFTTLGEILQRNGYNTAGVNAGNPWLTREYGYDRGFMQFADFLTDEKEEVGSNISQQFTDLLLEIRPYLESTDTLKDTIGRTARGLLALCDNSPMQSAETVTDWAVDWISTCSHRNPFFLWIHYMDPHYPWMPAKEDQNRFSNERISKFEIGKLWHAISANTHENSNENRLEVNTNTIANLYDAEIYRMDAEIKRLVDLLKTTEMFSNTIIAIVGDHGTGLGERGYFGHGPTRLYNELIHVPMVLSGPGVPSHRVATVTSHIDVPTTILEIVGIDANIDQFAGKSIATGSRDSARVEVVYDFDPRSGEKHDSRRLSAWIDRPWKLILNEEKEIVQLFNLKDDPNERENIAKEHPQKVENMVNELQNDRRSTNRYDKTLNEKRTIRETISGLKKRGRI